MSNKKIRECWEKFVSDEKYKEYFMSNEEVWYDNLEKAKKFIDEENKRPCNKNKNQDEKYLGGWIGKQLVNYNKKAEIMKDKIIRECWEKFVSDEKYKEYFMSNEEVWYDNLEKVKKFIDGDSKRPSSESKNQDEKYLGGWIGKQLVNYNKKTQTMSDKNIRECWEKFVSDEKYEEYFIANNEVWFDNLEKVKEFIDTEDKRPSKKSKNQDEKYLGSWISNQLKNYKKKTYIMKYKKIQECWEKFIDDEKYKEYLMSNDEMWHDNLKKVKKFMDGESKRPTQCGNNQDEKYLGTWISNQLKNYKEKTNIMRDKKIQKCWEKFVDDEKYKEYFMSNEDVWHDNLKKVTDFMDAENKRPSKHGKNQDEKCLGQWIVTQSRNHNKKICIMSDEKIYECWEKFVGDEKYKEYFVSNEDVWYDNLEKVKEFINTYHKRPSSHSKNRDEKYLGMWIVHQSMNYNKTANIMSNENIQECWKKFISNKKYKEYFM
jgi:phenylalanine-4-hydroxylase